MPSNVRVVLVTAPVSTSNGGSPGADLARALVTEGLAACVNRLPSMKSTYLWEGELHEDPEEMLVIKTSEGRVPALTRRIEALHPYDVPELLVLGVDQGLPAYLDWVMDACAKQ